MENPSGFLSFCSRSEKEGWSFVEMDEMAVFCRSLKFGLDGWKEEKTGRFLSFLFFRGRKKKGVQKES